MHMQFAAAAGICMYMRARRGRGACGAARVRTTASSGTSGKAAAAH
eukprot:COSAG02_NODE_73764_length_167_cov_40.558824_1_plen_45_part_10